MAENPFQPSEIALSTAADYPSETTNLRPLLSLWRRVVSVALITLGATFTPALLASPVAFVIRYFDLSGRGEPDYLMSVVFLAEGMLALAMIWLGFRLRRLPETATATAL